MSANARRARGPVNEPITTRLARFTTTDPATGCWLWTGSFTNRHYGRITIKGRMVLAHRASYEAFRGPIAEGLVIDHLCRTPACINPAHLDAVSQLENIRRGATGPLLKTHCVRGHELAGQNLIPNPHRRRICRECNYARGRGEIDAIRPRRARGHSEGVHT